MAETRFQRLSAVERRDALDVAARHLGRETFLLEKDTWIVATLEVLFEAPFGRHLVFKGGTSLSKVWRVIRRFSEDIDITYDIRGFAPDLVAGDDEEAPTAHTQPGEALDAGDPAAPCRLGTRNRRPARPGATRTRRIPGAGTGGGRAALHRLRTAVRATRHHAAVSGNLRLVPSGAAQKALAEDYASMLSTGTMSFRREPVRESRCGSTSP